MTEERDKQEKNVLLITDIGRDIDDTIALLCLIKMIEKSDMTPGGHMNLVGVVTSGGATVKRAEQARTWLQLCGSHLVPVFAGPDNLSSGYAKSKSYGAIEEIKEFTCYSNTEDELTIQNSKSANCSSTEFILQCSEDYQESLIIVCIAPLTPLVEALNQDANGYLKRIGGIFLQGTAEVSRNVQQELLIFPDYNSYNFSEDKDAALKVFSTLSQHVPFTLLGKYAAYEVGITKQDFQLWDDNKRDKFPSLESIAKKQMNRFRMSSPDIFYSLYRIPEQYRNETDWYNNMPMNILSHPYDPLLILLIQEMTYEGTSISQLFEPEYIETKPLSSSEGCRASQIIVHTLVGNAQNKSGIRDAGACRALILDLVKQAMSKTCKHQT